MAKGLDTLYKNQSLLYKYLRYVLAVGLVVYFFPKGGKFKYEFQKGKPWQHETLYAPFDFSVKKTSEELSAEKAAIQREHNTYFSLNDSMPSTIPSLLSSPSSPIIAITITSKHQQASECCQDQDIYHEP